MSRRLHPKPLSQWRRLPCPRRDSLRQRRHLIRRILTLVAPAEHLPVANARVLFERRFMRSYEVLTPN